MCVSESGVVAQHFLRVPLAAGEMLFLPDHLRDLLLGQPIAFDARRIVRGVQASGLAESCQHRGGDG